MNGSKMSTEVKTTTGGLVGRGVDECHAVTQLRTIAAPAGAPLVRG